MDEATLSQVLHTIDTQPWPKGFKYAVAKTTYFIELVMFQDNLDIMTGDDKNRLTVILMKLALLTTQGVPLKPVVKPTVEAWRAEHNV